LVTGDETWIVGLDLQPTSRGAIELATWLAETNASTKLMGVHVLEEGYLRSVLKYHHLDEVVQGAKQACDREIQRGGAPDRFVGVDIVQGGSAEKHLATAAERHDARGIVIGRQAPKDGRHLLRLGRVARRLLRSIPRPTIVVPPDWEPPTDRGPVIAATNLRGDCAEATRFARELATRFGLPLVIVHVLPLPEEHAAQYLPESSLEKLRRENLTEGTAAVQTWVNEHGFAGSETVIEQGGVAERVVSVAEERRASIVCTGSRHLSTFERVLLSSIGSELAASSPCPVAVVPPVAAEVD
jgi:nucleotide-binding universal stress UspA family protein